MKCPELGDTCPDSEACLSNVPCHVVRAFLACASGPCGDEQPESAPEDHCVPAGLCERVWRRVRPVLQWFGGA